MEIARNRELQFLKQLVTLTEEEQQRQLLRRYNFLSKGSYRHCYYNNKASIVIKFATYSKVDNMNESIFWDKIKTHRLSVYFAPVIWNSPDFKILVMEKADTELYLDSYLREDIKNLCRLTDQAYSSVFPCSKNGRKPSSDIHHDNVGYFNGKLVLLDYGHVTQDTSINGYKKKEEPLKKETYKTGFKRTTTLR